MRNIYTVATDKPSMFWYYKSYEVLLTGIDVEKSSTTHPQNIYITHESEKIEEGNYGLGLAIGVRGDGKGHYVFKQDGTNFGKANALCADAKKIILTTDKDLIRDGVQQIDYYFVKWFLKNQSCESVEVLRCPIEGLYTIIPKEEQKQHLINMMKSDEELGLYEKPKQTDEKGKPMTYWGGLEKPKQETLEEAETVEEYFLANIKNMLQFNNDALAIRFMEKYYYAKQEQEQERSYSEEEVLNKLTHFAVEIQRQNKQGIVPLRIKEWFERNKKK